MRIEFKLDHPYVVCPICTQMYKITQRKKRMGSKSFEIHDAVQHIKTCAAKKEKKLADELRAKVEEAKSHSELDNVSESNHSELDNVLESI